MSDLVIRIDGVPESVPDRVRTESLRLLVADGQGHERAALVILSWHGELGADADADADAESVWRASVFFACEELETAFKGEGWGVHLDAEGPPFVVEVSADAIERFMGEPSSAVSLEPGAVVADFTGP